MAKTAGENGSGTQKVPEPIARNGDEKTRGRMRRKFGARIMEKSEKILGMAETAIFLTPKNPIESRQKINI